MRVDCCNQTSIKRVNVWEVKTKEEFIVQITDIWFSRGCAHTIVSENDSMNSKSQEISKHTRRTRLSCRKRRGRATKTLRRIIQREGTLETETYVYLGLDVRLEWTSTRGQTGSVRFFSGRGILSTVSFCNRLFLSVRVSQTRGRGVLDSLRRRGFWLVRLTLIPAHFKTLFSPDQSQSQLYCQFCHMYSTYIQRIEIALLSDPWCIDNTKH